MNHEAAKDAIKSKVKQLLCDHHGLLYSISSASEQISKEGKVCIAALEDLANKDITEAAQGKEVMDDLSR